MTASQTRPLSLASERKKMIAIQSTIASCRVCPKMIGPPVHGPPIISPLFLLGQAPGPHEARLGRPFAYTAGRTLFRWFQTATGIDEVAFRQNVYMAAVARCFPGKALGGGDRVPDTGEIINCGRHLDREVMLLEPRLVIAVGKLAIAQTLGPKLFGPGLLLKDVVGKTFHVKFHGHRTDAICLPHPSGLSTWHRTEPGVSLLAAALKLIATHSSWRTTFSHKS